MRNNTSSDHRAFVLTTARAYVPGSLPKETYEMAPGTSGGGCCGSAPTPNQESSGCGTSGCGTTSTVQQRTSCC